MTGRAACPTLSGMLIDVFSDPICPWCFIGKRRLEAAQALRPQAAIQVRWRAFQLNPDMPPDGLDRAEYLRIKFGGGTRVRDVYDHIGRIGAQVGIDFAFDRIQRTPNTLDAHRLIRHAQTVAPQRTDALVERLFRAYFLEGRDIGDLDTLAALAGEGGLDPDAVQEMLDAEDYIDEIAAEDDFARRSGIAGVPCFIVAGRYALSGAQEPESFLPLIDVAAQDVPEPASSPAE